MPIIANLITSLNFSIFFLQTLCTYCKAFRNYILCVFLAALQLYLVYQKGFRILVLTFIYSMLWGAIYRTRDKKQNPKTIIQLKLRSYRILIYKIKVLHFVEKFPKLDFHSYQPK